MPGTRTALFSRNQPGGIFAIADQALTTGDSWFVDSVTGTNAVGYGQNPDAPFKSLDYAVSRVSNNKGDRIYVMPGHIETLTAAGSSLGNGGVFIGSTLSNDVEIIGLGVGRHRPVLNYTTAAAASMNITAANVTLRNLVFTPNGFGAITAAVNVTGADVTFDNCDFQISTGTNACLLGILTAATAARLKVLNCRFLGPATSTQTCTAAISHEVGIDFVIKGCEFIGKLTQGILNAATILGGLIDSNRFHIYTGTEGISIAAGTTCFIVNNYFCVPSGTAPVIAAGASLAANFYTTEGNGPTAGTALAW